MKDFTCQTHPTRLVVQETGFCFGCYEAARDAKYAALTVELERLLSSGVSVLETWPSGTKGTAWLWTPTIEPTDARIYAETVIGADAFSERHEAFIRGLSAQYLADHLVNRARGFGTTLEAFCLDCGETTLAIPTADNDPVCAACLPSRQVQA